MKSLKILLIALCFSSLLPISLRAETPEFIIPMAYDSIGAFYGGIAMVGKDGIYGYINSDGKVLTELIYTKGEDFKNGYASVSIGGKWGFVDTTGKEIVAPTYDRVQNFSDGFAKVQLNNLWGIVNGNGEVVVPVAYKSVEEFSNGLAAVCRNNGTLDVWGYADIAGNEVIECQYSTVKDASAHHVAVKNSDDLWGMLDHSGNIVIDFQYSGLEPFSEGLAAARKDSLWGYINENNEAVIPFQFTTEAYPFMNGQAKIPVDQGNFNDYYKIIDKEGAVLSEYHGTIYNDDGTSVNKFSMMGGTYTTLYAVDGSTIDYYHVTMGREDYPYTGYTLLSRVFCEGLYPKPLDDEYIYVDIYGNQAVPGAYHHALGFQNGHAIVSIDGKWGMIDTKGNTIIPFEYKTYGDTYRQQYNAPIDHFTQDGLARVVSNNLWGFVDKEGKKAIELKYTSATEFDNGFAIVTDNNRAFVIDTKGDTIFSGAKVMKSQGLYIITGDNGRQTLANAGTGTLYEAFTFDEISGWSNNDGPHFKVTQDGLTGLIKHPEPGINMQLYYNYSLINLPSGIVIDQQRPMVPFVELCSALSWTWDYAYSLDKGTLTIPEQSITVEFILGSSSVAVNGKDTLQEKYFSKTINNQVYIDMMTLAKISGIGCVWDSSDNAYKITA